MTRAGLLRDRRLWLLVGVIVLAVVLRAVGAGNLVSWDVLRAHRHGLEAWVRANPVQAASGYFALYVVVAAFVPGALVLTAVGGFLFGALAGGVLTVLAATLGATLIFTLARAVLGPAALDRLGPRARRLGASVRRYAWSYLLALRLAPLFPFFLVNLVPAVVGVRLTVFVLTTLIGIIPGTVVFSLFGAGLGSVLDSGGTPDLRAVLTPRILAAMLGLAVLSLAAIPIRARFGGDSQGKGSRP